MTVAYAARAERRLRGVARFHAEEGRGAIGVAIVAEIRARAELLAGQPDLGAAEPRLAGYGRGHRSLLAARYYRIVYYVEGDAVIVATVFDVRQDPGKLLGEVRE